MTMESMQPPHETARLILPTESIGWSALQTLRSRLSGRIARFRPRGVPRNRPKKTNNDAIIFEIDLRDVFRAKPVVIGLTKEDYDEMNEMALDLLGSLDTMVNLEICRKFRVPSSRKHDGNSPAKHSTDDQSIATIFKGFERLAELMHSLASLDESPSPLAAEQRFNVTTEPRPLFTLPTGNAGTLAIGQLRKWKVFLDDLTAEAETSENLPLLPLDVTPLLNENIVDKQLEKRASIVVNTIFREFRQLSCSKEETHEIRLHVSDELYTSPFQPNLDMFVSCCPGETLIWQEAECGSFNAMTDAVKGTMCTAIRQAMEKRRRLHILVNPHGLFDVTDKLDAVQLPSDNFDGESLSELFDQGVFNRIELKDYINQTANKKVSFENKARIALGLSRCLMDFFDEGLELSSHSWTPDNIYLRLVSVGTDKETKRRLYVSFRPSHCETGTSEFINMFKNGSPVLLSFARLLLEVLGGSKISIRIHPNEEENIQNWLDLCDKIDSLDPREYSSEYLRVVKGCLDLWKRLQKFEDRTNLLAARKVVRGAIYEEIIQKLELIVNSQPSKRKRRDSTLDYRPTKKISNSLSGLNLCDASSQFKRQEVSNPTNLMASNLYEAPIDTNMVGNEEELDESLDDLENQYGVMSLYDEQEEEQMSNRRKATEYFMHLNKVTLMYIQPLLKFSAWQLPPKQRSRIKVAIIDSGIDMTDPYISGRAGQIWGMRNWTSNDPDNCHDTYGHGTQVARLLLQVAPAVELYIAKVSTGREINQKDTGRIAKAIEWATAIWRVDILSMSLGLDGEDEKVKRALDKVLVPQHGESKKIVIAAAANWGGNHAIAFPGCYKGVLCIHSTDGHGNPSPSNPTVRSGINFAVLGLSIKSSVKVKVKKSSDGVPAIPGQSRREVTYISGTSYATAIAAGIAANVLEFARHNPYWSEGEREMLYSSWGMRLLFKEMGRERKEHHYILPWKLFDGRPKEEIWRDIQDILRGQRWRDT